MGAEKTIEVQIGAKTYRIASDDDYLEYIKGGFEPDMVHLFGTLVPAGGWVLDVGANIGCTSLLFSELGAKVVSFEPSPTTFAFLSKNIATAGAANVELNNLALGARIEEVDLTFSPSNRSGGFVSDRTKASAGHVTERIRVTTLDDFVARGRIPRLDFVKIDVEGFEQSVIQGASATIDRFKPVVVLELNHWCLNAFQRISIPDFFDFLRARFPILMAIDGDHYGDLHDLDDNYRVMYEHIIHNQYKNIVGAFSQAQLASFHQSYRHVT